jgi:hypothetical protein
MRRTLLLTQLIGCLAACKFPELPPVADDENGDAAVDGAADAAVDAPVACQPNTIDCDDAQGVYTECSPQGVASFQMQCPLGCASNMEKCVDIDPSNGLAMYLDMAATAPDLVLADGSSINPHDGAILVAGVGVQVPSFTTAAGIRVFVVRSLSIGGTTSVLRRYNTFSVAFVSHGDVTISGLVDVSAQGSEGGAGAAWGLDADSDRTCYGHTTTSFGPGAGGAGGAEPGGGGGATSAESGASGGTAMSYVEPLRGGCEGGTILGFAGSSSVGGGGGGALQITSRTQIRLTGSGTIDASGGGAVHLPQAGERTAGGGGGGGGNLLLEAPQVILDGAAVAVSTKGGGGAGASSNSGSAGADGGFDAPPASGGPSPIQSHGGAGGTESQPPRAGFDASCSGCEAGGGGGAVGLTVFRTLVGAIAPQNGAAVRSKQMVTSVRTRLVP